MQITLPSRADAQVAVAVRDEILSAPPGNRVVVDASDVSGFSTPIAMVLLAARARSGGLVLRRPSDAVVDGFSTLGLFAEMMTMELEG